MSGLNARSRLSVLVHADKALDLVRTAHDLGLIAMLDAGPVTLGELADATGTRPLRLYKFLDGLESLGLVTRHQPTDLLIDAWYESREPPLAAAVEAVLGDSSIERDRDTYPWREIHGRLAEVLRGDLDTRFAWPPRDEADVREVEARMAAGCAPIVEALQRAHERLFGARTHAALSAGRATSAAEIGASVPERWLDVGGGDGTVAEALIRDGCVRCCDVFNLPCVGPLVIARAFAARLDGQLGFISGDFLADPLPSGYDVLSFVRVLHDWPPAAARLLLKKARRALAPGARIVICEELRTPDRLATHLFWTYFLIGADACASRLREAEWYVEALAGAGFGNIRVMPGAFDVITAVAE